jgi:hypothetical protein
MCMSDKLFDIGETVAGRRPGTKLRAADIDSIGTMIYGTDTAGKVFCRGQQFNTLVPMRRMGTSFSMGTSFILHFYALSGSKRNYLISVA